MPVREAAFFFVWKTKECETQELIELWLTIIHSVKDPAAIVLINNFNESLVFPKLKWITFTQTVHYQLRIDPNANCLI